MIRRNRFIPILVGLVSFFLGILVASPQNVSRAFEPAAKATPTISKRMNANQVDNIHAAKTPVENRLLALDSNAKFPLSVMPDDLQKRVAGNCAMGSAVRAVNADGSVECENIPSIPAYGQARAGGFAYCDKANSTMFRSFNNVTQEQNSISNGDLDGTCTIDFGFDLSDAYIIASPGGPACPNGVRSVDIELISGSKVTFETEYCNNSARNIFVIVF